MAERAHAKGSVAEPEVPADVLDPARAIVNVGALVDPRQDATGYAYADISCVKLLYGVVCGGDVSRSMLRFEVIWVGIYTRFPERINLAPPLKQEFAEFFHGICSAFREKHIWNSLRASR